MYLMFMQSIEAMETICHELKGLTDVPEYIIKDADRLVLDLTMMVNRTLSWQGYFCRIALSSLLTIASG
jgi:hypothetical protein